MFSAPMVFSPGKPGSVSSASPKSLESFKRFANCGRKKLRVTGWLFALASVVLVYGAGTGYAQTPTAVKSFVDSLGIRLVRIEKGAFEIGAIPISTFRRLAEQAQSVEQKLDLIGQQPPQRPAEIERDYFISAHEITVSQFREFIKATNYQTDAEKDGLGGTGRFPDGRFGVDSKFTWQAVGFELSDDCPVVNVSWNDANAFCRWLSRVDSVTYRLPTELEWEYACRAGTQTRFSSGELSESLKGQANVADQSLLAKTPGLPWAADFDDGVAYLARVGSFAPNKFGLYDMHGNALEWCQDRFSFLQPLGMEPENDEEAMYLLRGGNWFNEPLRAGSACRSGAPATHRMSLIGFRIVRTSAPTPQL